MSRKKSGVSVLVAVAVAMVFSTSPSVTAQVILDTDFTAAEGLTTGPLIFQDLPPNAGDFRSQNFATVDPTGTGTVTQTGNFGRQLFNLGARGSVNNGGGFGNFLPDVTGGFAAGDQIRIAYTYQFTLGGTGTTDLGRFGIRDGFGGFGMGFADDPNVVDFGSGAPDVQEGIFTQFNAFQSGLVAGQDDLGGSVRFFPAGDQSSSTPAVDSIFLNGPDVGIDPSGNAQGGTMSGVPDFESDQLEINYLIEHDGIDSFSVEEFTVRNTVTDVTFAFDTVANPQTFQFLSTVDSTAQGGVAVGEGSPEAFLNIQLTRGGGASATIDSLFFEFLPGGVSVGQDGDFDGDNDVDAIDYIALRDGVGQPTEADFTAFFNNFGAGVTAGGGGIVNVVPEPTSVALIGLAGIALAVRRKTHC